MDAIVDPDAELGGEVNKVPAASAGMSAEREPLEEPPEGGGTPHLALDGFSGPLDHLLSLARAQKIDVSLISLEALVDQLTAALRHASAATPLGQKADWLVMAAWLVQLRTRLLLPADAAARQEAQTEADAFRGRLVALEEMRVLARWLERRPQLGHDVFARGRPEVFGVSVETAHAVDVIEFLWASLALFDDAAVPDTAPVYRPVPWALHTVAEARNRIMRLLAETPDGAPLEWFLSEQPEITDSHSRRALHRRSAWSSTLVACLELARQGDVALAQEDTFAPIHVSAVQPSLSSDSPGSTQTDAPAR
jgi:segregation and condensation protein A